MKKKQILSMFMGLCVLGGSAGTLCAANVHGTMRDITPADLAKEMTAGWNLGNSLDAYGAHSLANETYWGNPKTTKAMIDAVKNEGFNTIRIPVSWGEHVGSAPNYTIDTAWMNRVQEVVDYAMADDMYVLLDTHHEESWLKPQSATLDASQKELAALWTQIAERFKDYGDHLLFEGMNEPRIVGSSNEWSGGDADGRAAVNALNQTFIDAVRKTGGNNAKRCLVICPYGNNGDPNGLSGFKIPNDKNIMVAIHAYTPYGFTYRPDGNPSWAMTNWDGSAKSDIEYLMNTLNNNLISKGVTVIITEFGAVNKNNESEVVKWAKDYMSLATKNGIKCVWWDNNYHQNDGESFGLLDRNSCSWTRKSVADAVIKYAGAAVSAPEAPEVNQPVTNYATLNDGWYYIKNTGAQKYLQVKDNKGANGQNVEIGTGTGVAGQKWQLINVGEGYVTLKNGNGYMLDVDYGKDENGTNIQTYSANGMSAQQFKLLPTSQNGVYGVVTKCATDTKGLDVVNKATTDGANVQEYAYYGAANQTWVFESCGAPGNVQQPSQPEETPSQPEAPDDSVSGDTVKLTVVSDWNSGATAEIKVTNLSSKALNGWTCTFTTDRPITSIWSAKLVSQSGNTYTISNPDWQPNLAAGESYTFGCSMGPGPAKVTVTNVSLE